MSKGAGLSGSVCCISAMVCEKEQMLHGAEGKHGLIPVTYFEGMKRDDTIVLNAHIYVNEALKD